MSRSDPQVNFRIPAELKAQLEDAAEKNKRSITAELVARLEESFVEKPTMIFVDECHRSEHPSPERALELIEQLKSVLVGFTATPKE